jgi:hypothetical protein
LAADQSLKPDPGRKGSYYRRIEDIQRAIDELQAGQLPDAPKFLAYFFGCEKLAQGIVGINLGRAAVDQYRSSNPLGLTEIKAAAVALNLKIAANDLDDLFADYRQRSPTGGNPSARVLRNTLSHDFGPWHVQLLGKHAPALIPKMVAFLGCAQDVLKHLENNYAHVP